VIRPASATHLAWATLALTLIHFVLQTGFRMVWGQPLPALTLALGIIALMMIGALWLAFRQAAFTGENS
jgi:hypothetical protein